MTSNFHKRSLPTIKSLGDCVEGVLLNLAKIFVGLLFFVYGLPVIISIICAILSWIENRISGKKVSDQEEYYKSLVEESNKFMYGRR